MKLHEITSDVQTFDATALIAEAKKAGEKLFDSHKSGLIFDDKSIRVMPRDKYADEGTPTFGTFDYLFRPPKDVSEKKITDNYAKNGVVFIGSSDGVLLLTLPGVKVKLTNMPKLAGETGDEPWYTVKSSTGYTFTVGGPPRRKGQQPLSSNPKQALKQLDDNNSGYGMDLYKIVSIEKATDEEIAKEKARR